MCHFSLVYEKLRHVRCCTLLVKSIPRTPSQCWENDKDASKPVARHFNLPNHSLQHMAICGLSLHLGTTESHKNIEQKFIFQISTLNPYCINERFSFN